MHRLPQLKAALDALPDGGRPHVRGQQASSVLSDGVRLNLVTGAWVELGRSDIPVALDAIFLALMQGWKQQIVGEPYDIYRFSAPGAAAIEIRAMSGISLLWAAVADGTQSEHLLCVQDDPARWQAEEQGEIGPDFTDHQERNATWAGLGKARPPGWTLEVVDGPSTD